MTEILSHYRFQYDVDVILRDTRENLRLLLIQFYKEEIKKFRKNDQRGIIMDYGSPTRSAVLLPPDGNLRRIQYGWTPEPDANGHLSDLNFCVMAIGYLRNPPKYPKALLKPQFIKSHAWD